MNDTYIINQSADVILYGAQFGSTQMKKVCPKFIKNVLNTNELTVSIQGKSAMPMVIKGKCYWFLWLIWIFTPLKIRIYQMAYLISVSIGQILLQCASIFKECSRILQSLFTYQLCSIDVECLLTTASLI